MSNLGNNILDDEELLKNDFEVTYSPYWQKVERVLKIAFLLVVLGIVGLGLYVFPKIGIDYINLFLFTLPLMTPVMYIFYIHRLQQFRKLAISTQIKKRKKHSSLYFWSIILSVITGLITLVFGCFLVFFLIVISRKHDQYAMNYTLVLIPLVTTTAYQTFYSIYNIKYINQLKNQYV